MRRDWLLRNEGLLFQIHDPIDWALDQIFAAGELSFNAGAAYLCTVAHTAVAAYEPGAGADWEDVFQAISSVGPQGDQGLQGIPGGTMAWKGAYSAETTYEVNDGVLSSEGRAFYALQETTGHAPPSYPATSNAYWSLFAEAGVDGIQADGSVAMTGALTMTQIVSPSAPGASKTSIYPKSATEICCYPNGGIESHFMLAEATGWVPIPTTCTYASADSPTFTFTIAGDWSTIFRKGTRFKLTQTTAKYFICSDDSVYSAPNTTVTVYGGTDYTLADAAITSPYFSNERFPYGFPVSESKWSVIISDANDRSQASPTQNTWYNLGSLSIVLPIGSWETSYAVLAYVVASGSTVSMFTTLSTANNSESDPEFSTQINVGSTGLAISVYRRKVLDIASKTTYYLIAKTDQASMTNINFLGTTGKPTTKIRAAFRYL